MAFVIPAPPPPPPPPPGPFIHHHHHPRVRLRGSGGIMRIAFYVFIIVAAVVVPILVLKSSNHYKYFTDVKSCNQNSSEHLSWHRRRRPLTNKFRINEVVGEEHDCPKSSASQLLLADPTC
ncbi:hypothetical protein FVEG_16612 [Fusarium verticillioides 7600]|uniref:Uncharacterized protein n=1 Tax=Gibberella moniliformis (strain M3125 / FGSC 7600) TaxID=334819 RepID=W7MRJ9_GIBM7|nr:hypothetical protein FVEG_16612 [Fusarium verticillioides 7600]EWG50265.1 hypothetical protein FVEG_16612 [Fusarium verticillioides 7600]RBQ76932.1 hypothetical protein FVER14953_20064 [Fusarium verticillioides]